MKATAEDFKDILTGKIDKVAAVKLLKIILEENHHHCKITRRKTATGHKIYFHITRIDVDLDSTYDDYDAWWHTSEKIIQIYFPKACLISGGIDGWVIAEY